MREGTQSREGLNRTAEMRKLLMPTLGDMGKAGIALHSPKADFRSLLPPASPSPQIPSPSLTPPLSSLRSRSLPPGLIALIHAIVSDLESRPTILLGLNPSRREAINTHLNKLASGGNRPNLSTWLESPRSPSESNALFSYFEEIALMTIGQAILLKRWSERGLRPFSTEHLGKLNFELSTALRPHVPLHREGFHLTRPNLYSWYTLPTLLQEELFRTLEPLEFREESPTFLLELCTDGRRFFPDWPELLGYDSRFYQESSRELYRWSLASRTTPGGRRIGFTPTLRLGQITHGNANEIQWIGCEENTFALLISEMIDLWWGPKAPPAWANSSSLDAHPKEQLPLLAPGLKPGVLSMLSDMEACDFGWITEERTVKASRYRSQIEALPFYRKLRVNGTSLGTLQACVALTKIRPGGRLLWAREEPLTGEEGSETLAFLLGRGKLLAEVDLSHIEHSLPTRRPLFPRFLYVFERELNTELRLANRPVRWIGQGAIKSHVEVALFLNDLLASIPSQSSSLPTLPSRTNWKFTGQASPLPQKEWVNHWPDPSCAETLSNLEALCRETVPLANLATIRPVSKTLLLAGQKNSILDPNLNALFVESRPERREEGGKTESRRLETRAFRELTPGLEYAGFAIHLRDESWIAPIRAYLQSTPSAQWLEHHAERRSDRWVLSESLLKMLPIPERLANAITLDANNPDLRSVVLNLAKDPESIGKIVTLSPELRFIVMSQASREIDAGLSRLRPFLNEENRVDWTKVLGLFRAQETVSLSQHALVRVVGQIPVNSPITKLDRLKSPQNGILLMTESGAMQKVLFDHRILAEMAWDQARTLVHPTWGELIQHVRLPRTLEMAETAASDILLSYEALSQKSKVLGAWLSSGLPTA